MNVPPRGYRWWYVDATSQDGRCGITLIAFVGSVFSPYYAWSGRTDPLNHCALNVCLYRPGGNRWAMTERRAAHLRRQSHELQIGPSQLSWDDGGLTIRFDEVTAPLPSRLSGTVRLCPSALVGETFALDASNRHHWRPIAPRAEVEVSLSHPECRWRGEGYFDTNAGDEPLEDGFHSWEWSRARLRDETRIFYDVERRDGSQAALALRIGPDGTVVRAEAPPAVRLPRTLWGMPRSLRSDPDPFSRRPVTLEDTPFYARSLVRGCLDGEEAVLVHESLSLDRFRSPLIRAMLPFRMPRVLW